MATAAKKAAPKSPAKSTVSAPKKQKKTTPKAAPAAKPLPVDNIVNLPGTIIAPEEGAQVEYFDGRDRHTATVHLVHEDMRIDATVHGEKPFGVSAVPHASENPDGPHWFAKA